MERLMEVTYPNGEVVVVSERELGEALLGWDDDECEITYLEVA